MNEHPAAAAILPADLEQKVFDAFNSCCEALKECIREEATINAQLAEIAVEKHRLQVFIEYYSRSRGFVIEDDVKQVLQPPLDPKPRQYRKKQRP